MSPQLTFAYPDSENNLQPRRLVHDLPVEERPLYRLHQVGAGALATTELLALVLGTAEAPGLADELLRRFGSLHQPGWRPAVFHRPGAAAGAGSIPGPPPTGRPGPRRCHGRA